MAFFLDQLWLIGPATLALGLFLCWVALQSAQRSTLFSGVLLILVGVGMMAWDFFTESPVEQVRATLEEMVRAAKRGESEVICQRIGSTYQDGVRDQAGIQSLIRTRIGEADIENVTLAGVESTRQGENIEMSFVAHIEGRQTRGAGGLPTGSYPVRLRMLFRREGEGWRVEAVRRFDIIQSANEIPLDSLR